MFRSQMFFESEYWQSFTISQAEFKTGYSTYNSDTFIILCIGDKFMYSSGWKLIETLNKKIDAWFDLKILIPFQSYKNTCVL